MLVVTCRLLRFNLFQTKDLNDILETVQKRLDKVSDLRFIRFGISYPIRRSFTPDLSASNSFQAMKWDHHNAKTPGYIEDVRSSFCSIIDFICARIEDAGGEQSTLSSVVKI